MLFQVYCVCEMLNEVHNNLPRHNPVPKYGNSLYEHFQKKDFLSFSISDCLQLLLEYSNNLFYKYTHFLTNIFQLSQILTTYRLFIYLSNFRYDFYEFVEITVLLRYFFNEMPIKLTNSSVNQVLHALDLNARILTHCPH